MYKILIAFLIICTTASLPGQTSPRSGSTQSANTKTTISPAEPRSGKSTSGSSRDAKTLKQAEPSKAPAATGSRVELTERGGSANTNTSGTTARGSSGTKTSTVSGSAASPRRSTSTRPAYTSPSSSRSASRSAATQKKKTVKPEERVTINWLTLEQALEKSKTEKRKIFVDVYTNSCGWCKHMDSTTFVSGAVARYLNENYYPVKFNAEQQGDIVFKDKTYRFKKSGSRGHHELAAEWLNNRLTFPTIVFLDESQGLIQSLAGYQDVLKMEAIINYFATDSHKKMPWESYERKFVPKQ